MRPEVWLYDRLAAQSNHADEHQVCLAHLIRDAQYAIDDGDAVFAPPFKEFLERACEIGGRRPNLADSTINDLRRHRSARYHLRRHASSLRAIDIFFLPH